MNRAGRLLSVYDRLAGKAWPNDKNMGFIWAEVFDFDPSSPHAEDDVIASLQAVRAEVQLLRAELGAAGATEEMFRSCLERFKNVTSPTYLNQPWTGMSGEMLKPDNRITLLWAKWCLRDQAEGDLADADLAALRKEIDELEASLESASLPEYLSQFVKRQLEAVRSALRLYRVKGVRPLNEALEKVVGACTMEKSQIEATAAAAPTEARPLLARFGAVIKKAGDTADSLDKVRKAGEGYWPLLASAVPLLTEAAKRLG